MNSHGPAQPPESEEPGRPRFTPYSAVPPTPEDPPYDPYSATPSYEHPFPGSASNETPPPAYEDPFPGYSSSTSPPPPQYEDPYSSYDQGHGQASYDQAGYDQPADGSYMDEGSYVDESAYPSFAATSATTRIHYEDAFPDPGRPGRRAEPASVGPSSGRASSRRRDKHVRKGGRRVALALGLAAAAGIAIPAQSLLVVPDAHLSSPQQVAGSTRSAAFPAGVPACNSIGNHLGRMFPGLPGLMVSPDSMNTLADAMKAEPEADATPEGQLDDEENINIEAGYTYAGQFLDHDTTLTNEGDLSGTVDPATVTNERTPKLDLDSVFGGGPNTSPQLFDADGMHLKLGNPLTGAPDSGAVDQLRDATGTAIIGDPRNDENKIVASLHTIVMRFYNLQVDRIREANPGLSANDVWVEAAQQTRWYYQTAVVTDFLPQIVGQNMVNSVLPSMDLTKTAPNLKFYDPCTEQMPVEWADAAYRYGHSMVRALYRPNNTVKDRLHIFAAAFDPTQSMVGFQPSPQNFAIDWGFFFSMDGPAVVDHPQQQYKMDTSLVFALSQLPVIGAGGGVLSTRNLFRGEQMGIPSGQDIAKAMGVTPLPDSQIVIGKATGDNADIVPITDLSPEFAGKAPLWTYILAENMNQAFNISGGKFVGATADTPAAQARPFRMGPVGGRIVTEVIIGMLAADKSSVLFNPEFKPDPAFTTNGQFHWRDLINAVSGHDVAMGKPATAAATAAAAVDGDPATAAKVTDNTPLTVDLGTPTTISRIRVDFGDIPKNWAIQVGDGTTFTTVANSDGVGGQIASHATSGPGSGPDNVVELVGLKAKGQFVRVVVGGSATVASLQVFPLKVMPPEQNPNQLVAPGGATVSGDG